MDPKVVQNFRYKLQKRVRRLNSIGTTEMFVFGLRQFWRYFDNNPILSGIVETLIAEFPSASQIADQILQGVGNVGDSEEEAAAFGYQLLRKIAEKDPPSNFFNVARPYGNSRQAGEALEVVKDVFLEPFYEYVDEQLDDQRATLGLLMRYKHRCEWFFQDSLMQMAKEETRKAEKRLALDLYSYLHDQGIDFHIEPSSLSGAIDLISAQNTDDPLLADTKIFDGVSRGRNYIRKAFNQIYTYTQQYNESVGYLLIYKITDRDLRFQFGAPSRDIPVVVHNHKAIFVITIDIYQYGKPVSHRDPLKAVEIAESDLIEFDHSGTNGDDETGELDAPAAA